MRVLHLEPDRYDDEARRLVVSAPGVDQVDWCGDDPVDAVARLGAHDYGAVFTRLGVHLGPEALAASPSLRVVVTPTTGLDHIDLDAAAARGIAVVSLRGHVHLLDTVAATAELTWALLLAVVRRLPAAHASVLAGEWRRDAFVGTELRGRTLGVVGYGRLGRMVATYGHAFGMDVLVHDHDPAQLERAPTGVRAVGIDELLAASDVVSLHLPLDAGTAGYLSAARVAALKPGAVLVNTARGELVDEAALVAALVEGRLGGVAVDVVADDSTWPGQVPAHQPLVELARTRPDLVVTPHIGGYGRDAIATTRRYVAELFAAHLTETAQNPDRPRPEGSVP